MKSLFEQFRGTYRKESDYTIPHLKMPEADDIEFGIYGQRHLQFLQQHRKITYINLLTSGILNQYLAEIDRRAQERFSRMVEQMKQVQGITEQLKADIPMEWSKKMNCIRQQAEEVIFAELIYN